MPCAWIQVGGNHIRVDRACPPRKKLKGDSSLLYDNKRTVFVGNLPFDVKVRFLILKNSCFFCFLCSFSTNITMLCIFNSLQDEEIYKLFSGIKNLETSIEAVRVIRDPGSSLGKGIAYVLFKTTVWIVYLHIWCVLPPNNFCLISGYNSSLIYMFNHSDHVERFLHVKVDWISCRFAFSFWNLW